MKYQQTDEYPDPRGGTRWAKVAGQRVKVPRTLRRAFLVDSNKRYPLIEILLAKGERRRLKPQTKAARW